MHKISIMYMIINYMYMSLLQTMPLVCRMGFLHREAVREEIANPQGRAHITTHPSIDVQLV